MNSIKNLLSEIYQFWRKIFYGTEDMPSIFSFKGRLNWRFAWATAIIIYLLIELVSLFEIPIINYLFGLLMFYCILALVQKRCRDFGSRGTFWVLYITFTMFLKSTVYYLSSVVNKPILETVQQMDRIAYCLLFILFFIPSKPDADENLRSPLLKYPLLYTSVCWVLAISLTLAVKHHFIP